MSEVNFTKAPWKFNAHDGYITDCTKAENEITTVQLDDWHHLGMGYSNAHLIAAAPEMYAMLKEARKLCHSGGYFDTRDKIDLVLAKARGE